jgi:ABC-type multidrug transport system fused ATPase/permease subunit
VLGRRTQLAVGIAAFALSLEKAALVGATLEVVWNRPVSATLLGVVLAGLFLARSAARSFLQVEVAARVVEGVTASLLRDDEPGSGSLDETEAGLVAGLYASVDVMGQHVPELLGDAPACACMVAIACLTLPPRLVVEGGAAMLLGGAAALVAQRSSARAAGSVWQAFESLLEELSTAVRGRVEIVASGSEEAFLSSLRRLTRHWRHVSARASAISFLTGRVPALAVAFGVGLVLVLDEEVRGTVSQGILGRVAVLASMTPAFSGLARAWFEIGKSRARIRPITDLLERGTRAEARGRVPPDLPAIIALERVSFSYGSTGAPVLSDRVESFVPSEVTMLTGPNGCGKSTLLAILSGLAAPTKGVVRVAGVNLRDIDRRLFRQRIGYLPQRPFLPSRATVGEALRLIAPETDETAWREALEQVDLWRVLKARCPGKLYETKVGSLSAGEGQRLALARVLARRTPVLLLDEPDSNLDAEGVELMASLLRELRPGRVVVVAAHSERIAAAADRVVSFVDAKPRAPSNGEPLPSPAREAEVHTSAAPAKRS